jgi:hypothetical protein
MKLRSGDFWSGSRCLTFFLVLSGPVMDFRKKSTQPKDYDIVFIFQEKA